MPQTDASSLEGKVVIVTGGARGMGRTHVDTCIARGARVVLTDVLDDLGHRAVEEHGEAATYLRADASSEKDWYEVVRHATDTFGRVDGLVNNAGILFPHSLVNTTLVEFERTVAVNQTGVFLGMRAVLPAMEASGGGSIVNISSVAGIVGFRECFAYTASKFAIRGMTKAAALELAARGIRVNSIHPGDTVTPMMDVGSVSEAVPDASHTPLGRYAEPTEISEAVAFLLSASASYITGAELVVDGGYTAA